MRAVLYGPPNWLVEKFSSEDRRMSWYSPRIHQPTATPTPTPARTIVQNPNMRRSVSESGRWCGRSPAGR